MRRLTPLISLWLMSTPLAAGGPPTFRAGAHAVDITPSEFPIIISGGFHPVVAERAADKLHARCLALDDGSRRILIAVVDSLMMPRELLDAVKAAAAKSTGIPPDRMLISATHTHSAPPVMGALGTDVNPEYARFLQRKLVEVMEGAVRNLGPAQAGWAVVQAPEHTHCRRWILRPDRIRKDPFGEMTVRANMHPGYQSPDFEGPAGPVDPGLSILTFQSPERRPIALLANYSMHYVGVPAATLSADYYGHFASKVEQMVGAQDSERPFIAMMSQGTSGDQHWMDYGRPRRPMDAETYAGQIAALVLDAWRKISYRDRITLAMSETRLKLARRVASPQRLAWAKQVLGGIPVGKPRDQVEVYAREQVLIAEAPVRELKLQAVRIGDLGIAAIPNEVFAITGLKIKAHSPLRPTFTIELANGAEGYIPPPEQHKLGGYTTWAARTAGLEVDAEPKIASAVLELLEEVSGKRRRVPADTHGPYARAVLASKPLAYWRGSEFGGPSAADSSGHGNSGLYEDGVAYYLEGPESAGFSGVEINRAPHFAGGRMRADLRKLGPRHSVELWFSNALPPGARAVTGCLLSMDGGATQVGIGGLNGAAGRLVFSHGEKRFEGPTEIALRTWHHLTLVRDGQQFAVYLDGRNTPEISGQAGPAAGGQARLHVAGCPDPSANFEGRIDEIAVFARPLPAAEIAVHYAASGMSPVNR
jgi:hypothetical protein